MAGHGAKLDEGVTAATERQRWVEQVAARRPLVLRYLVRRTGHWDDAEDLCGEVMERALAVPVPPPTAEATKWLCAVADNLCRRWRKHRERPADHPGQAVSFATRLRLADETVGESLPADEVLIPERVEQRDLLLRLMGAMQDLPRLERRLIWRHLTGTSVRDLAAEEGVSRHVISRRLTQARTRLLASLPDELQVELRRRFAARR